MNYNQCMEYMNNITVSHGMNFDLSSVRELLVRAGNPEKNLKIIHIAGTNAKGSLGTYLASILDTAGIRTGRFFSPALFSYREVFCVYHKGITDTISKEQTAKYITLLADIIGDMTKDGYDHPTAFEIETVMALMFLRDEKCEIAIIECGLGGKDDATNIIDNNLINVITPVGYDHMGILGNTIEEITLAKCGIIHDGETVVTGQRDEKVTEVIKSYCDKMNANLFVCDEKNLTVRKQDIHGTVYDDNLHGIKGIKLTMLGEFQTQNAGIAVQVACCLKDMGYRISDNDIKTGMTRAHFKGRLDKVNSSPMVYADGAHNPMAATSLKRSIDKYFADYRKIFVMGVFADKDYKKILEIMSDGNGTLFACESNNKRSMKPHKLANEARPYFGEVVECTSVADALSKACDAANESVADTVIICFGSLSIMKDVYGFFENSDMENCHKEKNIVNSIIDNSIFRDKMDVINNYERNRRFCGHDFNHLMDVARIAWILTLENEYNLEKDVVYSAALLHDIGRAVEYEDGTPHENAGELIADEILTSAGVSEEVKERIILAIKGHNSEDKKKESGNKDELGIVIKQADNLSRNCFICAAKDECKWPLDKKNKGITL